MLADAYKHAIREKATELGFLHCGFSKAGFLAHEAPLLETWLKNNQHGEMRYIENHFDKRLNPTLLVEGSQSVISLLFNYHPAETQNPGVPKIAKYAYGEDYHHVIKDHLNTLIEWIALEIGEIQCRVFVDSAPVMDKVWAKKSGLGWLGKNTNLIHPKEGSFFFIAEIISDLTFSQDAPMKDYCGTCTRCIDACPTDALAVPYQIDAKKCISYLTIELKDEIIPSEFKGKMEHWAFGCDICQDVCPWNRFSKPTKEQRFTPDFSILNLAEEDWRGLRKEAFQEMFKHSAIKRTKYEGWMRNVNFLSE